MFMGNKFMVGIILVQSNESRSLKTCNRNINISLFIILSLGGFTTMDEMDVDHDRNTPKSGDKMFTLKKWNAVAMWSWDVECDTCAICRVQVMGE